MLVKSLNEIAPLIGERIPEARKILGFLCKGKLEITAIYDHFQDYVHATNEAAAEAIPAYATAAPCLPNTKKGSTTSNKA